MSRTLSALVLSGAGRYADPWHPFAETTECIAGILRESGFAVTVAPDVDDALTRFDDGPDLVVVNVGLPRDGSPSPAAAARTGFRRLLASGAPVLALHASSTSFVDAPEWEQALGGRWERGTSFHPEHGEARVRLRGHPLTAGISDFVLQDERYTSLRTAADDEVVAAHEHDGVEHPLIWLREATAAHGRTAYDALGHDARSFASPEHREILRRLIAWTTQREET
ncbi:ThuA domain-containing protein [Rathayibacter sp. VKM Ac-2760]|uniref:ThuA domain-containing protein n=1 Tax=Rathayibacter sp. VKM Ac-2760 TaxID=2609253 RepID=UPI001FCA40D7|nr:ThuA domain-containing protein [Rathayibacter sp. VKM Ac-2760]